MKKNTVCFVILLVLTSCTTSNIYYQMYQAKTITEGIEVSESFVYLPTGKTIALTRQAFVGRVMSLLFNMLSRFAIAL